MTADVGSQIEKLRREIERHNYLYFVEGEPKTSDREFDALVHRLEQLERKHPELITPDSPTQRVGPPLEGKLPKVPHKSAKFSLADAFEAEELEEFDERVKRFLKAEDIEYSCEIKIDGLNVTLWYEKGVLKKALTRGDGKLGEDVTHSIRTAENIPLVLFSK